MASELLADRYELVSSVGKGATGEVWRATDTLLQRNVAVKVVDLEGTKDPAMAQRFRREGIAIAGLNNSAIVKVFDTGTTPTRGWLVMELLTGPNCNTLVRDHGPLDIKTGLPLLARVADGLQAAHDAGITHRDVKPANIVLDAPMAADGTLPDLMTNPENGRPVLVDFGIAQIVDEVGTQLTRPSTAIGTAAYMSPEQARGHVADPASDVYSLACVTYYLLLGRPPFTATSSLAVAHSQAFDTPPSFRELAPDCPEALDALLKRMLAKKPEDRPTAAEVANEMRSIVADPSMAPTVVPDPDMYTGQGPAASETKKANKKRRATLIALLLVLVALGGLFLWRLLGPRNPAPTPSSSAATVTTTHTIAKTSQPSSPSETPTLTQSESSAPAAPVTVTQQATTETQPTTETTVQAPTTVHATTTVVQTATAVATTTVTEQAAQTTEAAPAP